MDIKSSSSGQALAERDHLAGELEEKLLQFHEALGQGMVSTSDKMLINAQGGDLDRIAGQTDRSETRVDTTFGTASFLSEALQNVDPQV
jgi:hypothetical protein